MTTGGPRPRRGGSPLATLLVIAAAVVAVVFPAGARAASVAGRWTQLHPTFSPTARRNGAMAYDPADRRIVEFGGEGHLGELDGGTFTFSQGNWTERHPATGPLKRSGDELAYDAAEEAVMMFGGQGELEDLGDTWTYAEGQWTQLSPAHSPSPRERPQMAYDPAREELVLFGGNETGTVRNDTWTFRDGEWTQRSPATSPPVDYAGAMAYDPASEEVVLFGGYGLVLSDATWSYDGTTWTKRTPAVSPPATEEPTLTYDAALGGLVLFSGETSEDGTWLYADGEWTELKPAQSPPGRFAAGAAYDEGSGELILFGGYDGAFLGDTWSLSALGPPSATIAEPADGQVYELGQSVPTSFACAEAPDGPGIASCADSGGASAGVGLLDTSTPGAHTYTVTASSLDGLSASTSIDYTVLAPSSSSGTPSSGSPSGASTGSSSTSTSASTPRPSLPSVRMSRRGRAGAGRYIFRLSDSAAGVTFRCRLDGGRFKACRSPVVYRHLKRGRHTFRTYAVDGAGQSSPTRVVRFRVGR